jgi:hypothetical protein
VATVKTAPVIPPINIEPAPSPIPESVRHPGSLARSSMSSFIGRDEDSRLSIDTADRHSESPETIRSQDRRSLSSRFTGVSVRGLRKTLSFRGKKEEEN